nr:hypothetical protein [Tanacetum cinerariifolium]
MPKDAKELKIHSLGSKSGIKANEEALNKKNHFHYTHDLSVLKEGLYIFRDRALTEFQRRLDLAESEKAGTQLNVNKLKNESKSLNKIIECQIVDNCKKGLGYNSVHTGLFPPPKSDLSSIGLEELFNEPKTKKSKDKSNDLELESLRKELSTKLSDRVLDLEKIKTAQAKKIADLKKRVKKLERKRRSRTLGINLFNIGTSRRRSLGKEDASKKGRNFKQRSIFEESDFDVQAMMDADYELAARLRAEEQRRKPLTKDKNRNQI